MPVPTSPAPGPPSVRLVMRLRVQRAFTRRRIHYSRRPAAKQAPRSAPHGCRQKTKQPRRIPRAASLATENRSPARMPTCRSRGRRRHKPARPHSRSRGRQSDASSGGVYDQVRQNGGDRRRARSHSPHPPRRRWAPHSRSWAPAGRNWTLRSHRRVQPHRSRPLGRRSRNHRNHENHVVTCGTNRGHGHTRSSGRAHNSRRRHSRRRTNRPRPSWRQAAAPHRAPQPAESVAPSWEGSLYPDNFKPSHYPLRSGRRLRVHRLCGSAIRALGGRAVRRQQRIQSRYRSETPAQLRCAVHFPCSSHFLGPFVLAAPVAPMAGIGSHGTTGREPGVTEILCQSARIGRSTRNQRTRSTGMVVRRTSSDGRDATRRPSYVWALVRPAPLLTPPAPYWKYSA
jgi:hypothetical protein